MKITILDISPDEEDEIIIKCHSMSDDVNNLICRLKQGKRKIAGYDKNVICMLDAEEIYYFDTIDNRVFAYCSKDVYEVKENYIS